MKTITNYKCSVTDGKLTITADVEDIVFNQLLSMRVTHVHVNPDHLQHPRHIQATNVGVFVKSPKGRFVMSNEFISDLAAACEPLTSFAPVFKKPQTVIGSVEVVSESPVTYQWEISDNAFPEGTFPPPVAVWNPIVGATSAKLDLETIKVGQFIRCLATNATGTTMSQVAKKIT